MFVWEQCKLPSIEAIAILGTSAESIPKYSPQAAHIPSYFVELSQLLLI